MKLYFKCMYNENMLFLDRAKDDYVAKYGE